MKRKFDSVCDGYRFTGEETHWWQKLYAAGVGRKIKSIWWTLAFGELDLRKHPTWNYGGVTGNGL